MKPTLHMIGLHHTINNTDFDHCAFSGKVRRFPKMMHYYGYKVIEYSNGVSMSEADEQVEILSAEELYSLLPHKDMGTNSIAYGPNWVEFNKRLLAELEERVQPGDIVCHPFGPVHTDAKRLFPKAFHVETGIGYHADDFCDFRIFESYAVMHYLQGKNKNPDGTIGRGGKDYEWVIPNYYDIDDWDPKYEHGDYLLYFGRITEDKGLFVVREIAANQNIPVRIVGSGDPAPFMGKNMEYYPPVVGARAKSDMLSNALAIIMPTRYVEPFGGSGVEAQLCGTPVISSDFGCYHETIEHGQTGFRCHTLGDYLEAIKVIPGLDRRYITERARSLYGLVSVGKKYDAVFKQIVDLSKEGWYTKESYKIDPVSEDMGYEKDYWGSCLNTMFEEEKQFGYATRMGLSVDEFRNIYIPAEHNLKVLDIGGGPVSMMLKCVSVSGGKVVDPIKYPDWTVDRYRHKGIQVCIGKGEDIDIAEKFDEVWIYNCLQHVEDPEQIIRKALVVAPVLRLFEWIEIGVCPGHPQNLTSENLSRWLGQEGQVEVLDEPGLTGKCFYGVFKGY